MKRLGYMCLAGLILMPAMALAAWPSAWTGAYVGGQAGMTQTRVDGFSNENALHLGIFGGYNYQVSERFVVGGDVSYGWNRQKSHTASTGLGSLRFGSDVYGLDGLLGFPVGGQGEFMPYLKIGYGHLEGTGGASGSDSNVRYGAGLEWRLSRPFSVSVQYMYLKLGSSSSNWRNETFTLGAIYHFEY